MALAIRVIACLDVDDGRVVKGTNFKNLRDAGDPVELAQRYNRAGADELVFLDITASSNNRKTVYDIVKRTAEHVFIPLAVGGGIRSVTDVGLLLRSGADKITVNTSAVENPELLKEIASQYGSQILTLSVDARRTKKAKCPSGYEVTTHGGKSATEIDALHWAREGARLGAGEILLNSMDADGTGEGFDTAMIKDFRQVIGVPLIASGGAGKVEHFPAAIAAGANAVLAASVFHYGQETVLSEVKQAIASAGYPVR